MGNGRERNKQMRDGDDTGNPRRPHRFGRMCRETCCQSKTETDIDTDDFFNDYVAISSACLD